MLHRNAVHGLQCTQCYRPSAEVSGGALLHSGVLVELSGTIFEENTAGEDGPAVMSLGLAQNISNVDFVANAFYCSSGFYGVEDDAGDVRPELSPVM